MTGLTQEQARTLARQTPHDRVQWRADRTTFDNSKIAVLAYVDSRYVMDTLDEIAGPGFWQDRYEDAIGGYRCGIGVLIEGEWIWKYDAAPASDIESIKGGHSDAMKRAAVKWGIGRDLYDYPDLWVPAVETRNGSGKYKPASLPSWNGQAWTVDGSQTRQNGHSAPVRPQVAPAPTRSSTDVPEDFDFDSLPRTRPVAVADNRGEGTMWSKELFERAEASNIEKRQISDTAKKMFGKDKWKVTDLTDGERFALAVELGVA